MSIYSEELSSCEAASNFYVDVFNEMIVKNNSGKILTMNLDIDRGILNFNELQNTLIFGFYSLHELSITQNYTSNTNNDKENYEQFISFLKELKLIKFKFVDDQSTFVKLININDIFEIMPVNSEYQFKLGDDDQVEINYKDNKCIKWSYNHY